MIKYGNDMQMTCETKEEERKGVELLYHLAGSRKVLDSATLYVGRENLNATTAGDIPGDCKPAFQNAKAQ